MGLVGDKTGSPVSQGELGGEPHLRFIKAHAAQGGVTLRLEQGDLGGYLGMRFQLKPSQNS